jgi:hypothetical protein
MYIDEVGNADMGPSTAANERYLSLTGVIIELDHVRNVVHPRLEALKEKFFRSHPDAPVILHRRDMLKGDGPFTPLRDSSTRAAFDKELLALLEDANYTVITAVIDKLAHRTQYTVWAYHPYHYCMEVLLERYVLWLSRRGYRGDVMAESRGGKEDRLLKVEYANTHDRGTDFVGAGSMSSRLTSRNLKIEEKRRNIAGLQFADVLAAPCLKWAQCNHTGTALPSDFGGSVALLMEKDKFDRDRQGRIPGYGTKWLP